MHKFTPQRRLTGGLRLPAHKLESTESAIRAGLVPAQLVVSTRQHSGPAAVPIVAVGQEVSRYDTLARADSSDSADVHAPASGRVIAIEMQAVPLASGLSTDTCIVIATIARSDEAAADRPVELAADFRSQLVQISHAGIVGLGGAVFPTAAKLDSPADVPCELLIINGAECEPYISCDDMLMRESPSSIIRGTAYLMRIIGAKRCVIAIERDKPQAIDAMTAAAESSGIDELGIAELPSIYPAGGERQLLEVLVGKEIPGKFFPRQFGYLCQNVGTAHAIDKYFSRGEPLVSRIVTVTGSGVNEPANVEALIGTPISELVAACGGYRGDAARLIHGGSMMGFSLEHDAFPITKSTNCLIVAQASEVRADTREWPCIRCGECAIACPARLLPQDLLLAARAGNVAELRELSLQECIECGCCDVVCPSHIPLTHTFRRAKPVLQRYEEQLSFTNVADERYQSREARRAELEQNESLRREDLRSSLATEHSREIEDAVWRARQRKPKIGTDGS